MLRKIKIITKKDAPIRILVVSAHTDDADLGMGATIFKMSRNPNYEIHYIAFSTAGKSLPSEYPRNQLVKEVKCSTTILGVNYLYIGDIEVREFSYHRQDILESLVDLKLEINPQFVFCPSVDDLHQDHKVVAEEVIRCFKHSSVYCYEIPWNNSAIKTDHFIEVSDIDLKEKLNALSCYLTQRKKDYFIRREQIFIGLASIRGLQAGLNYAEAFEQVRSIAKGGNIL